MAAVQTPGKQILIIDCQVFQTAAWHRGMGKYSRALLEALAANKMFQNDYDIQLLFNTKAAANQEALDELSALFPKARIWNVELNTPKAPRMQHSMQPVRASNKRKLNALVAKNFAGQSVAFLILAVYLDEVCSVFPDSASEKLLLYYDAIPYIYYERYQQFAGFFENFYMPNTVTVYEATKIFTISKTVANDLRVIFGLPAERLFNIDGASIPRAHHSLAEPTNLALGGRKFVLMPTGQELRKNNLRATQAFAQALQEVDSEALLVITSSFTDDVKAELKEISDRVIFSGNVSEPEILWLFRNCEFVLFPSEYEGLGLPILEAVEEGKLIACSDISVFREMSTKAFTYFDPLNVDSIAEAIGLMLTRPPKLRDVDDEYKRILKKYDWRNTARAVIKAMKATNTQLEITKKKVAIFCPDPTGFSAIGKVVTESHAWYSQYFDITYYFDKGPNHKRMRPDLLSHLAPSRKAEDFKLADARHYDAIVYHVGNSEYHLNTIHAALAVPGYVILHDTFLTGAYTNLVERGFMNDQRLSLEQTLDVLLPKASAKKQVTAPSSYLTSIVNNQLGVMVHSKYALQAVRDKLINAAVPVTYANLPVDTPIYSEILRGVDRRLTISFAGIIAKVKGTDIIQAIANDSQFDNFNINIFGYDAVEPELIAKLEMLPHVRIVRNPSDHQFQQLMAQSDVLINVRMEYRGETSLTTLEAMRFGAVVVVRNFGWYSELPDAAVLKVDEPSDTISSLVKLVSDAAALEAAREASVRYIEANHKHQSYAAAMYDLIK